MTFNWRYVRKLNAQDRWSIAAVEWLCWLRASMIPLMVILGVTHWTRLPQLYASGLRALLLNQMRQLADHHFECDGGNLELSDHIRDSCNYTSRDWLTWLFFPFAIRYHALHHLFPTLPYHNLKAAACLPDARLPADSPYRGLDQPRWWSVAQKMFSTQAQHVFVGKAPREGAAVAAVPAPKSLSHRPATRAARSSSSERTR